MVHPLSVHRSFSQISPFYQIVPLALLSPQLSIFQGQTKSARERFILHHTGSQHVKQYITALIGLFKFDFRLLLS